MKVVVKSQLASCICHLCGRLFGSFHWITDRVEKYIERGGDDGDEVMPPSGSSLVTYPVVGYGIPLKLVEIFAINS